MDQALFAFVLTEISQAFHWTVVERGWYITLTFTIAGVSITALGVLADRVGRKAVYQASIVVSSLLVAAMRWAPSTAWMLTLRTLGFATGGIQSPVTGTIVVEESPPRLRGLLSGVLQIGYPIGWYIAAQLAALIYKHYGWRNIFLAGLIAIPFFWIVKRYLRETKSFLESKASARGKARFKELFAPDLWFITVVLFAGEFLHVFAYGTTILLTAYFQEARGWEATAAIKLVGYSYAVGAIGYVLAAYTGEFLMKRRNTIIVWAWLGAVAFAFMIWSGQFRLSTILYYCLMTMFFYGATAVKFTFIAENFPTRLRATGVTFSGSLAVNLGVALGPLALSYGIARFGWNTAYTLFGVLPIFCSGLFFLLLPAEPKAMETV
jgi:MFS family permease